MIRCSSVLAAAMTLWLAAGLSRSPAADAPQDDDQTIRIVRVHAPMEVIERWPGKLLPMDRQEFERRLQLLAPQPGSPTLVAAHVVRATYQARLVGDDVLEGTARLQIRHLGEAAVQLPLDPCGLAIENARWSDGVDPPRPAVLGLGPAGRLTTTVEQSGVLEFDWALRRRRDASGGRVFAFDLPAVPATELFVDLPANLRIEAPGAIIAAADPQHEAAGGPASEPQSDRQPDAAAAQAAGREPNEPDDADESNAGAGRLRRWRVTPTGGNRLELTISAQQAVRDVSRLTIVRQALSYDISPRGTNISCRLSLDVHHQPLSQLSILVDPRIQLAAARYGSTLLSWSIEPEGPEGLVRAVLQFPERVQASDRVVFIEAIAPVVFEQPWSLPAIRPEGVFWQEGSIVLTVRPPLVLDRLVSHQAQQSSPLAGGTVTLRPFEPTAHVEVLLGWQRQRVLADRAVRLELDTEECSGQLAAELYVEQGVLHTLAATLHPFWQIDAVQSLPDGRVEDWTIERSGADTRLLVQLAPMRQGDSLRLNISGRRPGIAPGETLSADELRMMEFDAVEHRLQLARVEARVPHQLRFAGDARLERLDRLALSPDRARLVGTRPGGVLFTDGAGTENLRVGIEPLRPVFRGEMTVEALCGSGVLAESYRVLCQPQGDRMDRVIVHFAQRREEPIQWRLDREAPLLARRLSDTEQTELGLDPSGESWQITFAEPMTAPFELFAERASPWSGPRPVNLIWLPEASDQSGSVVIRAAEGTHSTIENVRLKPIPARSARVDRYETARAAYRYQPPRDAASAADPAIQISPEVRDGHTADLPMLWAHDAVTEFWFDADGTVRHNEWYALENAGRETLSFHLPAGAEQLVARVDGVSLPAERGADGRWTIQLPSAVRFPTLTLTYRRGGAPLGQWGALAASGAQLDVPVLASQARLWLPPEYAPLGTGALRAEAEPPTWSQRLFGPLGRSRIGEPADLLALDTYLGRTAAVRAEEAASERAGRVLARLGDTLARRESAAAASWGEILEAASATLLVDHAALAQLGVAPLTPAATGSGDASARALAALERAGMAVLVVADELLVTSFAEVALAARQCRRLPLSDAARPTLAGPYVVHAGWLADRLRDGSRGERYLSPAAWRKSGASHGRPWAPPSLDAAQALTAGWTVAHVDASRGEPARITVVRLPWVYAIGWSVFLVVTTVVCLQLRHRPRTILLTTGAVAAVALVVPQGWIVLLPWLSAAILGSMMGWVLRLALRPRADERDELEASTITRHPALLPVHSIARAIFIVAVGVVIASRAGADEPLAVDAPSDPPAAQEPPAPDARPPRPVHRVFFPIDGQQQPVGSRVYVNETLYQQLLRGTVAAGQKPQGWLLNSATYRAMLDWRGTGPGLQVLEWTASFDLELFDPTMAVRIPIRRAEADLVPNAVRVDDRLVDQESFRWDEQDDSFHVRLPQAGRYRLELSLRPTVRERGQYAGIELAIPPLPGAKLDLSVPPDAPPIELDGEPLEPDTQFEAGHVGARLGPARQIALRWPKDAARGGGQQRMEVDELVWIDVQPGAVLFRARLKCRMLEGQTQELVLAVDPRLGVLPLKSDSLVESWHRLQDDPNTLVLRLARPITDRAEVDVHFLLQGAYGVGNVRLPHLECTARMVRRWLAVSVDSTLQYEVLASEQTPPAAIPEWTAEWGPSEGSPPHLAYRLDRGQVEWSISTRRRQPQVVAQTFSRMKIDRHAAQLDYRADVAVESGLIFQYTLHMPAEYAVRSVSVMQDQLEQVAHWSAREDGVVTVFLKQLAGPGQQLQLVAVRPLGDAGELAFPTVELKEARTAAARFEVVRTSDVLVDIVETSGLRAEPWPIATDRDASAARSTGSDAAAPAADPWLPLEEYWPRGALQGEHLAGRWSAVESKPAAVLAYNSNAPRVSGVLVTHIEADEAGRAWILTFDWQLSVQGGVQGGVLDVVRLRVPDDLVTSSLHVSPDADWRIVDVPGESDHQLILLPHRPLTGESRLTIRTELPRSAEQRVPIVAPLGAERVERYIVLPDDWNGQRIVWDHRGLRTVPPETALDLAWTKVRGATLWQLADEGVQIVLKAFEQPPGVPAVQLADLRVRWSADGTCQGVATFDLLPSGAESCVLDLPQSLRLVHATVAGLPATASRTGPTAWRLMLGSDQLAQRIEVVFTGTFAWRSGSADFDVPSLRDYPVERTSWTVVGPHEAGRGMTAGEKAAVDAAFQELVRLRSMKQLISSAAVQPAEETTRWQRGWGRRFQASLAAYHAGVRAADGNVDPGQAAEVAAMEAELPIPPLGYVVCRVGNAARATSVRAAAVSIAQRYGGQLVAEHDGQFVFELPRAQDEAFRQALASETNLPLAIQSAEILPLAHGLEQLWLGGCAGHSSPVRGAAAGAVRELNVRYAHPPFDERMARPLLALVVLAVAAAAASLLHRRWPAEMLARYPQLAGAVVGIAWWLWLEPSALGWLIVAASGASSLRNRWALPKYDPQYLEPRFARRAVE